MSYPEYRSDPILRNVDSHTLERGDRLIRWIEARGLPRPSLWAVAQERRLRAVTEWSN